MIRKFILAALLLCAPSVYAQGTISAMTAASALSGTELFECVQSGSKKCTAAQIKTFTSASPTLVTPNLGTPSAGVATNLTGTASGLTAGTVTTNANLTGDVTSSGNATTLATVNSNVGSFTNSSITVNGKGLITAASSGAAGATLGANTFTALQTITQASANAGVIASTGYSLTGSDATGMVNLAGTWNTSGNPKGFVIAITRTAVGTNATAKYFEVLGGSTGAKSLLNVDAGGITNINTDAAISSNILKLGDSNGNVNWTFSGSGANTGNMTGGTGSAVIVGQYKFAASTGDLIISRGGVATLQQGDANAASPVAQTLQAQGSRSGTDTNVGGANYTIRCGAGTGTGTPCSTIFQSYVAVASGTGAQTATDTLTLNSGNATFAGAVSAAGITSSLASTTSIHATASVAGGQGIRSTNSNTGATAYSVLSARNDASEEIALVLRGTGYTTSGMVVASAAELVAGNPAPLLIRHTQAQPIIFAINGVTTANDVLRLTTTGATVLAGTAIPAGGTAATGLKFSSTANFGVFFGSGAPSLSAAKGSLYLRSDGSGTTDRAYINTNGSTTWTALTTAS